MTSPITHQERHIRKRLELLDNLLRNGKRTYDQLLTDLNKAIELHGDKRISIRTLKSDIAHLENDLGAPIHRPVGKDRLLYYTERFSIRESRITDEEFETLKNAVHLLRNLDSFSIVTDVEQIIRKLENDYLSPEMDNRLLVQFERQQVASGSEHFDNLLSAIKYKLAVKISYQPFNKPTPLAFIVHPYLLKEYRNRWFLFARKESDNQISTFALDRMQFIKTSQESFRENDMFDPELYFNHVIGVSVPRDPSVEKIVLKVNAATRPYVISKPIHHSQQLIKAYKDGSVSIELQLCINYELRSLLLSYGNGITVEAPTNLRLQMKEILLESANRYV